jgi:hypothetical protein
MSILSNITLVDRICTMNIMISDQKDSFVDNFELNYSRGCRNIYIFSHVVPANTGSHVHMYILSSPFYISDVTGSLRYPKIEYQVCKIDSTVASEKMEPSYMHACMYVQIYTHTYVYGNAKNEHQQNGFVPL